ncbi:MAG: DUF4352 domain-containing protein [Pyrinomonadaceae bacterium]
MGILLILMTIGGLIVAAILLLIARVTKKDWLKYFVFGGLTTWIFAYLFLLFCGSFFSVERTLAFDEPKEFCGFYFDCHLHAAVLDVRKTKMLGDKTASGEFYIVKVKISSDARAATLGSNSVDAEVIDANKQTYGRDTAAEKYLGEQPPFDKKISPPESFEKEIVFDLPNDVQNPRLDIREGNALDRAIEAVLIGDEDSIGHRRNYFKLETSVQTANSEK